MFHNAPQHGPNNGTALFPIPTQHAQPGSRGRPLFTGRGALPEDFDRNQSNPRNRMCEVEWERQYKRQALHEEQRRSMSQNEYEHWAMGQNQSEIELWMQIKTGRAFGFLYQKPIELRAGRLLNLWAHLNWASRLPPNTNTQPVHQPANFPVPQGSTSSSSSGASNRVLTPPTPVISALDESPDARASSIEPLELEASGWDSASLLKGAASKRSPKGKGRAIEPTSARNSASDGRPNAEASPFTTYFLRTPPPDSAISQEEDSARNRRSDIWTPLITDRFPQPIWPTPNPVFDTQCLQEACSRFRRLRSQVTEGLSEASDDAKRSFPLDISALTPPRRVSRFSSFFSISTAYENNFDCPGMKAMLAERTKSSIWGEQRPSGRPIHPFIRTFEQHREQAEHDALVRRCVEMILDEEAPTAPLS